MELLASHRKKKQGRFYQKVGGRGKKSRWQVTQGTLSNFFSIIGLLKKCICGTTNFFSPNCYPDQEENSGKSFKNTGQSRQLIIRTSLLSTQCLKNISNHCGSDYLQVWLVVVQTENLFQKTLVQFVLVVVQVLVTSKRLLKRTVKKRGCVR